ncbi:MAG: HAMP domain-containing sensor histidine kinase [Acidimicrobiales bacterium]|jgi:signal transduction histidine kinase
MHRRSLRLRLLVTFGLGAFILSAFFASLTYVGLKHILVSDQQQTDLKQSYVNAALVRTTLYTSPPELPNVLNSIEKATDSNVLIQTHNQWLSTSGGASTGSVSLDMIKKAVGGKATEQTTYFHGQEIFVVGIPIPSVESQYFEVFQLAPLEHTLNLLLLVIGAGAIMTLLIGTGGGLWVTRRTVRPLERVSAAAALIAGGELTTRLVTGNTDREVQQLTESFNAMVSQLVDRLERDARFASDVSHELRSPLTTLATTATVLSQHRGDLSPVAQQSLDLLVGDLAVFQSLVEDLLEIARSDAGASPVVIETVSAVELVRQSVRSAAQHHGLNATPVEFADDVGDPMVNVDRRRFERVMSNLIDNAHHYAGDAVAIRISVDGEHLVIDVDDAGLGVPPDEREQVFQRFFRGRAAHDRGVARGTGLGLALVRDHVQSFGGTIIVLESPEGGARFQMTLPLHQGAAT